MNALAGLSARKQARLERAPSRAVAGCTATAEALDVSALVASAEPEPLAEAVAVLRMRLSALEAAMKDAKPSDLDNLMP